jgi:hypothetical protein
VSKDINVPVVSLYFETTIPYPIPLVEDLHHLKNPGILPVGVEKQRAFVRLIAGITFNVQGHRHHGPRL